MGLLKAVVTRLLQSIIVLIGVTFLAFGATFLTGDPASLMLGEGATTEEIEAFRVEMGFDRPILVQYGDFLSRAVRGDFGKSLYFRQSNIELVMQRVPATVRLSLVALAGSLVLAIPLGLLAARHRNTWKDTSIMVGGLLGQATPGFWLGLMLIMVFAVRLKWVPVSGLAGWKSYILPAISLGTAPLAQNLRMMRSCALEVMGEDYIKTARAKGLRESVVMYKHVLKNGLKPVITQVGITLGQFLGTAVVVETIFAWPGIGRLAVQSIFTKDFPLLQTVVTFLALGFIVINLIVDLLYAVVDPRVRT
ncbi:MAG: ABC transporter permease [Clostridiales bacterium]|nr:ABC transporter permease [Clostridiales bacterium]